MMGNFHVLLMNIKETKAVLITKVGGIYIVSAFVDFVIVEIVAAQNSNTKTHTDWHK